MEFLTVREACKLSGIPEWAMYRLIDKGYIPGRRLGPKKIVILKDELMNYLKNLPSAAKPKQGE